MSYCDTSVLTVDTSTLQSRRRNMNVSTVNVYSGWYTTHTIPPLWPQTQYRRVYCQHIQWLIHHIYRPPSIATDAIQMSVLPTYTDVSIVNIHSGLYTTHTDCGHRHNTDVSSVNIYSGWYTIYTNHPSWPQTQYRRLYCQHIQWFIHHTYRPPSIATDAIQTSLLSTYTVVYTCWRHLVSWLHLLGNWSCPQGQLLRNTLFKKLLLPLKYIYNMTSIWVSIQRVAKWWY